MVTGTFIKGENKVRPGTYFNFESMSEPKGNISDRGIVLMPLVNNYGPNNTFMSIDARDSEAVFDKLGYHLTDSKLLLVKEAMKRAKTVIVYNINNAVSKASIVIGEKLTITAKYAGTRGNDLKVVVKDSVLGKDLLIYLGNELVYKAEKAVNISDLKECKWVDFTGTGSLDELTDIVAGVNLAGGKDVAITNADVVNMLNHSETWMFNTLCFPFDKSDLIGAFDSKIKYFRETLGKKVVGVRPLAVVPSDYEGIITVRNGVVLPDMKLDSLQACAWVAGASASSNVNESLTYSKYEGAIDANPRLMHTEIVDGLQKGEFIFTVDNNCVRVEQDINSLTTFDAKKDKSYSKNRVIRVLDEIANMCASVLVPNKYDASEDGYRLAKIALLKVLKKLESIKAIKNVNEDTDVIVEREISSGDELHVTIAVCPIDSIEKYYITVKTN